MDKNTKEFIDKALVWWEKNKNLVRVREPVKFKHEKQDSE